MYRRWGLLVVVAILAGGAWVIRHRFEPSDVRATETPVVVEEIVARGRLEPRDGVYEIAAFTLAPTASLGQLFVRENDTVAKGALLATLGSHDQIKTQVGVAAANLEVAERNLEFVRRPYKNETVAALRATINSRAADLQLAQQRVKRSEELVRKQIATLDDHETRVATADRADALLREAEARLKAELEVSDTELQKAIAQLAESRARLRDTEEQLALTEVRAPTDGTILKIHAKDGEMVPGRAIIELGDIRHPRAVAEVDERFIADVRPGQKAQIALPGGKRSWTATVQRVRSVVLDVSRSPSNAVTARGGRIVEVELTFDANDGLPPISGLELIVRIRTS
jgi:HlyD family secretion protein